MDEGYRTEIKSQVQTVLALAQDNAASSEETSAMTSELALTIKKSMDMLEDLKNDIDELQEDVKRFTV